MLPIYLARKLKPEYTPALDMFQHLYYKIIQSAYKTSKHHSAILSFKDDWDEEAGCDGSAGFVFFNRDEFPARPSRSDSGRRWAHGICSFVAHKLRVAVLVFGELGGM